MRTFGELESYPGDPILGLTTLFLADDRPEKVNLGVGVYLGEDGKLPLMAAVKEAQDRLAAHPVPLGYPPMSGLPAFTEQARALVFGADAAAVQERRIDSIQTLGGSGALKVAGDFLRTMMDVTTVAVSTPTWSNHEAIFGGAGLQVTRYRYYDRAHHGVDVEGMMADIEALEPGTLVLLHACCHNPTGHDLSADDWRRVAETTAERGLLPMLDMAYQGFGDGIEEDRVGVEALLASGQRFLVGNSFSKNMSLYGERVGALHVVCADEAEAARVDSQLCRCVRSNYSMPPMQGARLAGTVLADEELRASWRDELGTMRARILDMRHALVDALHTRGVTEMDFITKQAGMFSYSGFSPEEMLRLREEHALYGTSDGRMCVAGLNARNVDHVADAMASVLADR